MPTINGLRVYEYGTRNNTPVIFIHGFPMSSAMWANQTQALQDSFNCFAYDIRGLGKSEVGDAQYTIDSFTDDLFSLISVMGLKKPVLCGLSMGGYIALRALEREPGAFSGAILCNTRPEADTNQAKIRRADIIRQINYEGTRRFVTEFIESLPAAANKKRFREEYTSLLDEWMINPAVGIKGALLALAARTDTSEMLANLNLPVLCIGGEEDTLTTPAIMKHMASKIRGAELHIIPGTGHLTPIEAPQEVNRLIRQFVHNIFA